MPPKPYTVIIPEPQGGRCSPFCPMYKEKFPLDENYRSYIWALCSKKLEQPTAKADYFITPGPKCPQWQGGEK